MPYKNIFFGRFPAVSEVGGVTTFTYNFAKKFSDKSMLFLDFYPAEKKILPGNIEAKFLTGSVWSRLLKLWLLFFKGNYHSIFNFSSISSLLIIFFLPKCNGQKWVLLLHNGDQEKCYNRLNPLAKLIVKIAVKKIDLLCAISSKQAEFYKCLDVKKIVRVTPFIGAADCVIELPQKKMAFLISGFPTLFIRR